MKVLHYIASLRNNLVRSKQGFILPLTLVIVTITLVVATGVTTVLIKELYFSRVSRESSIAYYAADTALACAIYTDDAYVNTPTGLGIFPYDNVVTPTDVLVSVNAARASRGLPALVLNDIKCATSPVFDVTVSNYAVDSTPYVHTFSDSTTETGKTSTFDMKMDLGDGTFRCASVTINKTFKFRQIIARGYNTCDLTSDRLVERAIINTTESN